MKCDAPTQISPIRRSWTKPRRVVAKVEWHPSELCPRVGFIVTNMARSAENVVAFYNKRRGMPLSTPARKMPNPVVG